MTHTKNHHNTGVTTHILVAQLRLIHMVPTNDGPAATDSYGTNQAPNALKYVEVLNSQIDESHSHPGVLGTYTTPK